jgi:hypothetical protein
MNLGDRTKFKKFSIDFTDMKLEIGTKGEIIAFIDSNINQNNSKNNYLQSGFHWYPINKDNIKTNNMLLINISDIQKFIVNAINKN